MIPKIVPVAISIALISSANLTAYADDMLKGKDNIRQNRIFITHSGIDPDIIELVRTKINEWQPDVENIYVTRAGGTISCHCGPGTLGILYMYE